LLLGHVRDSIPSRKSPGIRGTVERGAGEIRERNAESYDSEPRSWCAARASHL